LQYELFIPDAISPNGDGSFDELYIQNIKKFPNNKVEIYNRWGSLLYEAKGYNNESVVWDGTHNGSVLPVASYYMVVDLGNGSDPISHTLSIFK
jgi:gliding motility-associated-like protein